MDENREIKKEDLLEIANWIMKVAEQSSFAHDELKALRYADTVRGAADQAETLRCAVSEFDQCRENLKRDSKMLQERNDQIEALQLQLPKRGEWVWNPDGMDFGIGAWVCGNCRAKPNSFWEGMRDINPLRFSGSRYCPNCGSIMGG